MRKINLSSKYHAEMEKEHHSSQGGHSMDHSGLWQPPWTITPCRTILDRGGRRERLREACGGLAAFTTEDVIAFAGRRPKRQQYFFQWTSRWHDLAAQLSQAADLWDRLRRLDADADEGLALVRGWILRVVDQTNVQEVASAIRVVSRRPENLARVLDALRRLPNVLLPDEPTYALLPAGGSLGRSLWPETDSSALEESQLASSEEMEISTAAPNWDYCILAFGDNEWATYQKLNGHWRQMKKVRISKGIESDLPRMLLDGKGQLENRATAFRIRRLSPKTMKPALSRLRKKLREVFGLDKTHNPLPTVEGTIRARFKIGFREDSDIVSESGRSQFTIRIVNP